jgi:uncharacterized protein (TIGR02246 family)
MTDNVRDKPPPGGEDRPARAEMLDGMTNPTPATTPDQASGRDEVLLADIPMRMVAAWNRGDADAFAAPFTDTADFVAFEGTHLRGRQEIAAFHRQIFATVVKGTGLEGGVRFVRALATDRAVIHSWVRYTNLPGDPTTPGRHSMQLFVATKRAGEWSIDAVQNSRQLTVEQQDLLDAIASLPDDARRQLPDLLASLAAGTFVGAEELEPPASAS